LNGSIYDAGVIWNQRGQILVSDLLRHLVGSLAGSELRDAGRKQLKGLPGRQRVYEVV